MNVLIFGAGAIGGLYGIMLANADCKVSVVCRSDADYIREHGLSLESSWGNRSFMPYAVVEDVSEIQDPMDVIIVATKALPGQHLPKKIQPVVSAHTSILLLQNGMFIEDEFSRAFPKNTVIRGLAFVCVSKPRPGLIYHQDFGRLVIGKYPSGESDIVSELSERFNSAGVPCKVDDTIQKSSWRKLIWNAPFNPMSVIGGGVNTQQMLSFAESREIVENIMNEVCLLANAEGYALGQGDIDKNIENTLSMHPYKTSMLLDYENGRPMEIDAILGNALKFAQRNGIQVPYMQTLFTCLKLIELKSATKQ